MLLTIVCLRAYVTQSSIGQPHQFANRVNSLHCCAMFADLSSSVLAAFMCDLNPATDSYMYANRDKIEMEQQKTLM